MEVTMSIIAAKDRSSYQNDFYNRIAANAVPSATKASLRKFLRAIDLVGWSRREESGRVDRRAFTRFAVGEKAVFSRREYKEAERTVVSLLIDASGSTYAKVVDENNKKIDKKRIEVFTDIAAVLSKLLDESKATFKVQSFSYRGSESVGIERVTLVEYKGYGESLRKCAANIATLPQNSGGSTPDYSAVYTEVVELAKRPESHKVLLLITDADDYDTGLCKHLDAVAKRLGVTIVAICVGGDISKCYTNHANAKTAKQLFEKSFSTLLNTIRR
jgi:nitric oxide reductase activation protein